MFTMAWDRVDRTVRYRLEGFWTLADVAAFRAALTQELRRRNAGGAAIKLLGDASEFPVQSNEVAAAFEAFMVPDVLPQVERLALVLSGALNKLQVARSGTVPKMRVFLDMAEAIAWLRMPAGAP